MTHGDVQAWLDRYVAAWKTYDPAAIGDLFSEDAAYRYHPADEPIVGRAAIVAAWVDPQPGSQASGRDEPGTYDARYEPYAVEGARAVAVGWSRYWTDATRAVVGSTFDNCFSSSSTARAGAGRSRSSTACAQRDGAAGRRGSPGAPPARRLHDPLTIRQRGANAAAYADRR